MPILGTIASSTRQGQATDLGAMFPLQVVTVGAPVSSVTFSNIPSTYTHLQIRAIMRTNRGNTEDSVRMQFNSDTGNNYAWHVLESYTGPTTAVISGATTTTSNILTLGAGNNASTSIFAPLILDIYDYANTNKFKTCRFLNSLMINATASYNYNEFRSGLWRSTNAISSIQFTPEYGTGFIQYSQFALYGVKSA